MLDGRGIGVKIAVLTAFFVSCAPHETPGPVDEPPEPPAAEGVPEAETQVVEPADEVELPPALSDVEPTPDLTLPGAAAFDHDALLEALRTASSREFKPVGHTSIVFRMRMDSEHTAAFRPRTRRHRRGHLAEVAAYALGRFLGLDNIVPATLRSETRRRISEHLHARYDDVNTWNDLEERIFYRSPLETPGAAIYWVPDLAETQLDRGDARREWEGWLASADIPEERRALARDLSNVRVFDYLIANWDRFSGGNLKLFGGEPERVALRDHNVAFGRLNPTREASLRGEVRATRRFSRSVIARLHQLTAEALTGAIDRFNTDLERRKAGVDVLHPAQLSALLERAEVVLSHVGALIEEHGEASVLCFE